MKLYSYVVARDFGFAPNPFYGVCTLATCKPQIRKHAQVGDWIVGTGSMRYGLEDRLVFVMEVAEAITFDEYWQDPRFRLKRPNLSGSIKQAFGDNIYHRDRKTKRWIQENSHHSMSTGRPNRANVRHDTRVDRVLIGFDFIYWGKEGPKVPKRFSRGDDDIHKVVTGHKCRFPEEFVERFRKWVESRPERGYAGRPREFSKL